MNVSALRTEAIDCLKMLIADGDPGQMRHWAHTIDEEIVNGKSVGEVYDAASILDRMDTDDEIYGEGYARSKVLVEAIDHLTDEVLLRLIEADLIGTYEEIDEFAEHLRSLPRFTAIEALREMIEDADSPALETWHRSVAEEPVYGTTVGNLFDQARDVDRENYDPVDPQWPEAAGRSRVLSIAIDHLSDQVLMRLITENSWPWKSELLDKFIAQGEARKPDLRVVGS